MLALVELLISSLSGLWHILELVDYVAQIIDTIQNLHKHFMPTS